MTKEALTAVIALEVLQEEGKGDVLEHELLLSFSALRRNPVGDILAPKASAFLLHNLGKSSVKEASQQMKLDQ